jgi:hypothetical protein
MSLRPLGEAHGGGAFCAALPACAADAGGGRQVFAVPPFPAARRGWYDAPIAPSTAPVSASEEPTR